MVVVGVEHEVEPTCCNEANAGVVNLCHIALLVRLDIFRAAQHKYSRRLCDNQIWWVGTLEGS